MPDFITVGSDSEESLTEADLEFMEFVADHMPPCRYTREGNVVTVHVQVPDNDAPIIDWFGESVVPKESPDCEAP